MHHVWMYWIYFSRFLHISGLLCRRKCWKEHHTSLLAGIGRMHFSTFLATCPPIGVLPAKRVDSKHKSWWSFNSFISFHSQSLGPKYTSWPNVCTTKRIPICIGESIFILSHKLLIEWDCDVRLLGDFWWRSFGSTSAVHPPNFLTSWQYQWCSHVHGYWRVPAQNTFRFWIISPVIWRFERIEPALDAP